MFNFKRRLEIKILKILQEVTFLVNLVIIWYNYFIFTGAQRSNNLIFLDLLREEKLNHVLESRIYRVFFACGPGTKVVTKTPLHKGVTVMKGERVTQVENVYVNRLVSVGSSKRGELPFKWNRTQR